MNTLIKITNHRYFNLILIATFLLMSLMRILFINADAPQDMSISAAIFTDEGFKTFAARNMMLFGDWKWFTKDLYGNWFLYSPFGTMSYVLVFSFFGIGFSSIKGLSIAYAIATIILLYYYVERHFGKDTAYLTILLFGLNFFNVMSDRMGFFETHLNFYIMLTLFAITEMIIKISNKKIFYAVILGSVVVSGLIIQYFLKKNFIIVVLAITPAILMNYLRYKNVQTSIIKRLLIFILVLLVIVYFILGHIGSYQTAIVNLLSFSVFGTPLYAIIPVRFFDTLPSVMGKGLYIEFIFLQPIMFTLAILYAIYVFESYISRTFSNVIDLYCASWLLFSFLLLTLMSYHPSRYYQLCSIPLALCSARAIQQLDLGILREYLTSKRKFPFNLMTSLLFATITIYSFVIMYVQFVPFSVRSDIMRILYPAFINNQVASVYYIIIPVAVIAIILIVSIYINRNRIIQFFAMKNRSTVIICSILILHLFQFSKWIINHEYILYNASIELGNTLPENAVIVGGWSSSLTIENNLRAIIIQSNETYNYNIIGKIIRGEPILVTRKTNDTPVLFHEADQPLYLAVSPNVIFEKNIMKHFAPFIHENNLIKKIKLGYFDIDIYKLPKNKNYLKAPFL